MLMRLCAFGAALVTVVAFEEVSSAWADDKVVGAIWEIKFEAKNPKDEVMKKFRATPDGKVWNMPAKGKPSVIGKWSGDGNNTNMMVSGTPRGPNGKFEIVQVGKNPPVWRGDFESENGEKRTVKVRLIRD